MLGSLEERWLLSLMMIHCTADEIQIHNIYFMEEGKKSTYIWNDALSFSDIENSNKD